MQKSCIIESVSKDPEPEAVSYAIPKCRSEEQFFTLNIQRKRKNNTNLGQSLKLQVLCPPLSQTNQHKDSQQIVCRQTKSDAQTDTTQNQGVIAFKKTKQKRRINLLCSTRMEEEGQKNLSLPKLNSISWKGSQNNSTPRRQRNLKMRLTSISDFKIFRKIGQGSYSQVFGAVQRKTGFLCALKKLNKSLIKEKGLIDVLAREIHLHYYLKHSNIIDLYGWFDDREHVYLICEYCTHGDLYKLIQQQTKKCEEIDLFECSNIIRQVCLAVESMHDKFVMHRDIKPENIFLNMGSVAKIGDLGWAVSYSEQNLRETHCGTPIYLAPELLGQKCEYSNTVDIWAIGILTYELITGSIPFKIECSQDLSKIASQEIDFGCVKDPMARNFIEKTLNKDGRKRMSIKEMLTHPLLLLCEEEELS